MAHPETQARCRRPQLDDVRIPRSRFLGPANASARIEQLLRGGRRAAQPFDVALMGCGGYGLPLAAYIRGNLSRSAIYEGGGTQLMFGIWGSRWVGRPDVKAIANEFWVHPSKSEVPSNAKELEGAAYF